MPLANINWNPDARRLRLSAACLPIAALLPAYLTYRFIESSGLASGILGVALVVSFVGLVRPPWFRPLYVVWTAVGLPFRWILSHVLLLLIFFGVVTPIGLLLRALGYDPMRRAADERATTYWVERPDSDDHQRYFRQY